MSRKSLAVVKTALLVIALIVSLAPLATAGTETTIYEFGGNGGEGYSYSALVPDGAGNLFGLSNNYPGSVFELTPDGNGGWNYNYIYGFTGFDDGWLPIDQAGVAIDSQGNIYGTCEAANAAYGSVWELSKGPGNVWQIAKTYDFAGGTDGDTPYASVLVDSAGNVYGTTQSGGANNDGTVFELTPSGNGWTKTTLHSFSGGDGARPRSSLVMDRVGNLYGTTLFGGAYNLGTVFELSPSGNNWTEKVLYSFTGAQDGSDGALPAGNISFDSYGRLYGTTQSNGDGYTGAGGVFRLIPSATIPRTVRETGWKITWLYHFTGGSDGYWPSYGVTIDKNGNVYGTTTYGGPDPNACNAGCGVAFELTPSGQSWTESVLYSFTGGQRWGQPQGQCPARQCRQPLRNDLRLWQPRPRHDLQDNAIVAAHMGRSALSWGGPDAEYGKLSTKRLLSWVRAGPK